MATKKYNIKAAYKKVMAKNSDNPSTDNKGKPISRAYFPFYGNVSNKIARILRKRHIRTVHLPPKKIKQLLRPVKDEQGLKTPGVYEIPCECEQVYIGQTGRTVSERISEHERELRMQYFDKSAVAQHALENNHHIGFDETRLIDRTRNYWDRIRREAIEIKLQPNNFNRDSGLHITKGWTPAISALRRLRVRGQHSTSAPALATLSVDHSIPDVGNAHSDWTAAGKISNQ